MMRPSDAESRIRLASELSGYLKSKVTDGSAPAAAPETGLAGNSEPGRGSGLAAMLAVSANHIREGFDPTPSVNRYEPVNDRKVEQYGMALLDGASISQVPDAHLLGAMEVASERFDKQVLFSEGDRDLRVLYVDNRDNDTAYFVYHTPSDFGSPDQDYHSLIANEVAFLMGLPAPYMRPANAGTDTDTLFVFTQSIRDAVIGDMSELATESIFGLYDPVETFGVSDSSKYPEHVVANVATLLVFDWVVGLDRSPTDLFVLLGLNGKAHLVPTTNSPCFVGVESVMDGQGDKFIENMMSSHYLYLLANEVKFKRSSVDQVVNAVLEAIQRASSLDFNTLERRFDESIMELYVPSAESPAYNIYGGFIPAVQSRSESLLNHAPIGTEVKSAIEEIVL